MPHGFIEDGLGNLIVVWEDERTGNKDIYVQKFDMYGNMLWATDGVPVCTVTGDQEFPSMVTDGAGGAIMAWRDYRDGQFDANIYSQRIDDTGAALWTSRGIAVVTATGNQYITGEIASDGNGGVFIAWQDERNGVSNPDIYIQWIKSSGAVQLTADGYPLCDDPDYQTRPVVVNNGYNSVIVIWRDSRGGLFCLYGSLISQSTVYRGNDGAAICSLETGFPGYQVLVPDGEGGVIVVWHDDRNGDDNIYAQRIDPGGNSLWAEDGAVVCDAILDQRYPMAVSDGDCGVVTGWYDYRKNVLSEIYLQRLDGDGNALWTDDGVGVDGVVITHYYPIIASDCMGGRSSAGAIFPRT